MIPPIVFDYEYHYTPTLRKIKCYLNKYSMFKVCTKIAAALTVFVKIAELYAENIGKKPMENKKSAVKICNEYSQKTLKYSK